MVEYAVDALATVLQLCCRFVVCFSVIGFFVICFYGAIGAINGAIRKRNLLLLDWMLLIGLYITKLLFFEWILLFV